MVGAGAGGGAGGGAGDGGWGAARGEVPADCTEEHGAGEGVRPLQRNVRLVGLPGAWAPRVQLAHLAQVQWHEGRILEVARCCPRTSGTKDCPTAGGVSWGGGAQGGRPPRHPPGRPPNWNSLVSPVILFFSQLSEKACHWEDFLFITVGSMTNYYSLFQG